MSDSLGESWWPDDASPSASVFIAPRGRSTSARFTPNQSGLSGLWHPLSNAKVSRTLSSPASATGPPRRVGGNAAPLRADRLPDLR